jgi:hypothetical protein
MARAVRGKEFLIPSEGERGTGNSGNNTTLFPVGKRNLTAPPLDGSGSSNQFERGLPTTVADFLAGNGNSGR